MQTSASVRKPFLSRLSGPVNDCKPFVNCSTYFLELHVKKNDLWDAADYNHSRLGVPRLLPLNVSGEVEATLLDATVRLEHVKAII